MGSDNIYVTKRDGRVEPLNLEKIHRVLNWAAIGLNNVSISQVEMRSQLHFHAGISTVDIHNTLIHSAADLISTNAPDYQYMSARLALFHLRKRAYGRFEPPKLYDHVKHLVTLGKYDPALLEHYSKADFSAMDNHLDHSRDLSFTYAAINQMEGKYLLKNRVTHEIYESPQFLYMLVSATLFASYPKGIRLSYIFDYYDAISLFKISLPTPIMAGVRTPTRQFSSCVLIDTDDNLDSINATTATIVKYVSQRAGIGINAGKIRALGREIRSGEALHTGCIPFYKYFQSATKSCSQGGVRGGSATLFYPLWHLEVESLLVLKNNRGVEENRVRHLDYGVQLNKLLYQRLIEQSDITLFSPSDVPGLYDAFFADQKKFEQLYLAAENDPNIRKKKIKAVELFSTLLQERAQTGRIYIQHVDHCNQHSPFDPLKAPIKQSNLCMEITLPTKPLQSIDDDRGEIALCTLSAFNLGEIQKLSELEKLSDLVVRALDNLLDYQDYPVIAAKIGGQKRRNLGIGVINFAHYLAKYKCRYSDGSANDLTHRTFEAIQYYLLKASNRLAQEKGACEWFDQTNYAKGILPIDTYKPTIDELTTEPLHQNWDALRELIKQHGLRHSTLTAIMPSETSSQISNATNGIEPPRAFVSIKQSKDGVLKQVVPELDTLKEHYELRWDIPNNQGYLALCGIMQKFVDQAISTNLNYDPKRFTSGKVPIKQMLKDLIQSYQLGLKTLYYHNTRDGTGVDEDLSCESGACKI